jgi:hypothetical protein
MSVSTFSIFCLENTNKMQKRPTKIYDPFMKVREKVEASEIFGRMTVQYESEERLRMG